MSAIVVAGNTSGSVTLDAPAVAGTTVITLPTTSGTMVATDSSGNVGIGTTSPAYKLTVQKGTKATTAAASSVVAIQTTDTAGTELGLYVRQKTDATAANRWTGITSYDDGVGAANLVLQDLGGNVGIGTTSPNVSGQSSNVKVATIQGISGNWGGFEASNAQAAADTLLGFYGFTCSGSAAGYTLPAYIGTWLDSSGTATKLGGNLRFHTQPDNTTGAIERMRITSTGLLQFNSGYGSVATAYGCRAWVNFNGQGTVAIRASGNVSSITDNGVGDYTINFSTAMPDANYGIIGTSGPSGSFGSIISEQMTATGRTASAIRIGVASNRTSTVVDDAFNNVAIFR